MTRRKPAYNNAQAEPEEDHWAQMQEYARYGLLTKDQERQSGVKNWNNPIRASTDDDGGGQ
jgi:hypothetical protein